MDRPRPRVRGGAGDPGRSGNRPGGLPSPEVSRSRRAPMSQRSTGADGGGPPGGGGHRNGMDRDRLRSSALDVGKRHRGGTSGPAVCSGRLVVGERPAAGQRPVAAKRPSLSSLSDRPLRMRTLSFSPELAGPDGLSLAGLAVSTRSLDPAWREPVYPALAREAGHRFGTNLPMALGCSGPDP